MAYTFDDFKNAATQAGLLDRFSQADLDLAEKYPEFGLSILSLKQDWMNATTDEQRLLANEAANQLRSSYGNYMGGDDGLDYVSQGKIPGQIDTVLDEIYNYGDFTYGSAPTYTNQYAQMQQDLLDSILNRPDFSYDVEQDPLWGNYRKSYLREGQRATADALGQASAASGGRPSTWATTAATQAGDYYATQLNDIIPELEQRAYERYLDDYNMLISDLGQVNTQEQMDYQKYLTDLSQFNTDRDFAFGQYLSDYDILQNQLAALQGQDQADYNRWQDQLEADRWEQQWQYEQQLDQLQQAQQAQEFAQAQVDAILSAGGTPSAELISQSGYTQEYVDALRNAYLRELAAQQAGGSSGGGRYYSSGRGSGGNSASPEEDEGDTIAALKQEYPGGTIPADVWNQLVAAGMTEQQLRAAGFQKQTGKADLVAVPGYGYLPWEDAERLVDQGLIKVTGTDKNGNVNFTQIKKPGQGNVALSR